MIKTLNLTFLILTDANGPKVLIQALKYLVSTQKYPGQTRNCPEQTNRTWAWMDPEVPKTDLKVCVGDGFGLRLKISKSTVFNEQF